MKPTQILVQIVVEVSRDGEEGQGTGFFISNNEVATCYHVLRTDKGELEDKYYIRHSSDTQWKMVKPDINRCDPINDHAILICQEKNIELPWNLRFEAWDHVPGEFLSKGYGLDQEDICGNINENTIRGKIINYLWTIDKPRLMRLEMESDIGTVHPGRSGSPIFSCKQNAIIGMMCFQAGKKSQFKEMPLAIPIESIDEAISDNNSIDHKSNVPDLPPFFLERKDALEAIKTHLLPLDYGKNTPKSCTKLVIHGMGGLGKSVLAAAIGRDPDVCRYFSDGVFWLELKEDPEITLKQSTLARRLDGNIHSFSDEEDGRAVLSDLLFNKNCLIILDDVWSAKDVTDLLDDLGPRSKMLITTRNASIVTALGAEIYPLLLLSNDQSLELFAKWAGTDPVEMPDEAKKIILECGNLPLALAICGALIKDGMLWGDLLGYLKDAALGVIYHEDESAKSVMKSMEISVKRLKSEVAERYRDLVVFSQDLPIPQTAITNLWFYSNNLSERDGRTLINDLNNKSLLHRIQSNGCNFIRLHPLQYDFLKATCGDKPKLHKMLLESYQNKITEGNWDTGPNDGYFFQHLPYHLSEAQQDEELKKIILNINWLQAKLQATSSNELIKDFDFLKSKDELLFIQEAIRLSAHILSRDPGQLKGQLVARLKGFDLCPIQDFISQILENTDEIWLRPIITSLTTPGGPLIKTVNLHTDPINAIAVIPGCRRVASSGDNTLKVWDLETGEELQILRGHSDSINAVAITPDGKKAISGSGDNTLRVWNLETGEELQILRGHSDSINAVAITRDGKKAISGSGDNTLRVWNLETGEELVILRGHSESINAVAVNPDGKKAVSGSGDNTLRIWDIQTGEELQILRGHSESISAVAITPDGENVVSGSGDKNLKVWDIETGREIRTMKGHTDWIYSLVITSDGKKIISGSEDKTLRVWDLENGKELNILQDHTLSVNVVAMSPDGKIAVSGSDDRKSKVWNIGKIQKSLKATHHNGLVRALSITKDCTKAVSGSEDLTLKVWDLENAKEIHTLKGHKGWVNALAITVDGKMVVSGSADATIKVWDMETGKELRTLHGHENYVNSVLITPDGKKIVSGSGDKTLKVWEIETGREIRTMRGHTDWINSIAITPDGCKVISGSDDKTIRIWDLELGQEISTLCSHIGPIKILSLACNGKKLICESTESILEIRDLEAEDEPIIADCCYGLATAIFIGSDGDTIASCSSDDILEVWKLETCKVISKFAIDESLTSIAVGSDGITIVAGDRSGHFYLFKLENYEKLFRSELSTRLEEWDDK